MSHKLTREKIEAFVATDKKADFLRMLDLAETLKAGEPAAVKTLRKTVADSDIPDIARKACKAALEIKLKEIGDNNGVASVVTFLQEKSIFADVVYAGIGSYCGYAAHTAKEASIKAEAIFMAKSKNIKLADAIAAVRILPRFKKAE